MTYFHGLYRSLDFRVKSKTAFKPDLRIKANPREFDKDELEFQAQPCDDLIQKCRDGMNLKLGDWDLE